MEVGTLIKILRDGKNISKEQMASYLGVSLNTYKKIEKSERWPNYNEIMIIANNLEIEPSFFFTTNSKKINHHDINENPFAGNDQMISVNKSMLDAFTKALEQNISLMEKLDKIINAVDKKLTVTEKAG